MAQTLDLSASAMVGVTRESLLSLCASLLKDVGPEAASYLQNAGYAGGATLFDAFGRWLLGRGLGTPESLDMSEFARRATEFFGELGWGSLALGTIHSAVATIDSGDWAEADASMALEFPGCHLTTGMFADFFGRLAGDSLAVMEVECRSMGNERCRFLVGSSEVMQHVYDAMSEGLDYEQAVSGVA